MPPAIHVKNLTVVFLVICFGMAAAHFLKRKQSYATAPATIQVTRIDAGGAVVHETLNTLLTPYLALYHGAGWCSPCQRFSPDLAEFYHSADRTKGKFQLVMVNYDNSDDDMLAYMREHKMEFPAVRRESAGPWGKATGNGIPNLVIIETATGKVVSSSYDGDTYVGPRVPLEVLEKIAR